MSNLQITVEEKVLKTLEVNHNDDEKKEKFRDWENVKDKICMRVIGPKMEVDITQNAFVMKFLNLSTILYIRDEDSDRRILIATKKDVYSWGLPVEQIAQQALNNTGKKERYILKNLAGYLLSMLPESSDRELKDDFLAAAEKNPTYVLSTMSGIYGASSILFTDIFNKICDDFECNLFILPSSVHELILVPDKDNKWSAEGLLQMVKDVNRTVVEEKDLLADNVYYYDRETEKVAIAA